MLRIIGRRLIALVGVLFAVSILVFMLQPLLPGDPAEVILGEAITPELKAQVHEDLGLDRPLIVQYITWVGNAIQGDLSTGYYSSEPVTDRLVDGARISLVIVGGAIVIASVVGIAVGIIAALRPNGLFDRFLSMLASIGLATPNFWAAMLLVLGFALTLDWFPATGYQPISDGVGGWAKSLALPTLALALRPIALIARMTRASMLQVLNQDYIRTAIGRGVPRRRLIVHHALRNALVPVVTVIGVQAAFLVGSTVIVERVFALPGLGSLAIDAIIRKDIPVVQGFVLLIATFTVLFSLLVDLTTMWLNPKVRLS
jgi:peptide/nickel transport system permease protein